MAITSADIQETAREQERKMDYCFDSVSVKNHKIIIVGWATVDDRKNTMRVYATDASRKEIPCSVTRACRPDVGLAVYHDTKASDVGLFMEVPIADIPLAVIRLEEVTPGGTVVDERHIPLNPALITARMTYKKTKKAMVDSKAAAKRIAKKLAGKEYSAYDDWYNVMKVTPGELAFQRREELPFKPKFSVIVPLYHTPLTYFRSMVRSVAIQSWQNWELILVNASPEDVALSENVRVWCRQDARIREVRLTENQGIAENTNAGIRETGGDFVCFLDHDDMLEPDALYCYARALNENRDIDLFYSDEDKIKENDTVFAFPNFKPDFSPDYLCSNNYVCHFLAVRKSLLDSVGGLRAEFEGAQDYDLILRLTERTNRICHYPKVLYHWRSHTGSTSSAQGNKRYAVNAGAAAINAHYERCGISAVAQIGAIDGWYSTRFFLKEHPKVSVLIPNKDHIDDLDKCIRSLQERSLYDNYEVIVIENNSKDPETFHYYKNLEASSPNIRVVYWPGEFNYSAINNFGRGYASGEYLLLLNNDIEVVTPDLLEHMLGYCMRPDVGIVGAKLLYDDHTVQHAGVLVGAGGLADHVFKGIHEDAPGYMGRAVCTQDLSAVTAACLMIRASVYDEVGGLDEDFKVAFNDVDLCLKVRAAGYLVVYDADVRLYHYESKSRGSEDTPERFVRFGSEMALLNGKWDILGSFKDPYYNPNLSYIHYYRLSYTAMERRQKQLEDYRKEHYGKKESNRSHSKL